MYSVLANHPVLFKLVESGLWEQRAALLSQIPAWLFQLFSKIFPVANSPPSSATGDRLSLRVKKKSCVLENSQKVNHFQLIFLLFNPIM